MKWFPDRPGMATGMAIMGFGGGALIGAPLGVRLMDLFRSAESVGVAESFQSWQRWYGAFMLFGAAVIRIPVDGLEASGLGGCGSWTEATTQEIGVDEAWRTPQFRLLWVVLCMNVSAGIGILGQSSKMCSDMFGLSPVVGGGFAGLLSIFNMGGRFFWSLGSDRIGRKAVYQIYFMFGTTLYCLVPWTQRQQNRPLFVIVTALIISMYGGGFATIPAYLRDIFGTYQVGAIHGRLITAWSVAALIGPTLVNYISTTSVRRGQSAAESYQSNDVS
jgi:nitrate/nitrite transporter NarK